MFEQIELKKQQLDLKKPLPKYAVQSVREKFFRVDIQLKCH